MKSFTWKIGGEAGFGVMTTGLIFAKLAVREGYHIFNYSEYPSLIRGGHNVSEVRIGGEKVYSQEKKVDVLFALNQETFFLHQEEVKEKGLVVYDVDKFSLDQKDLKRKDIVLYPLPLAQLLKEIKGEKVMVNNIALGASAALFSFRLSTLLEIIREIFEKKGQEIVFKNQEAARVGFNFVKKKSPQNFFLSLPTPKPSPQMVISGNEACGLGALVSGCQFFAAYPMTPTSSLLHFMAKEGERCGVVVRHAEDEIAVINSAIGASFAGVRSMVATAGGGFSLMVEGLGLAGITETPLVLVVGQRPGPATGMPTWTSQADLQFLIRASQDEFLRIVLAPGDVSEAFYLTSEAFNLADIYQTPVFILTDKYLAESFSSVPFFDFNRIKVKRGKLLSWQEGAKKENYLRYQITEEGISPRALPGMEKTFFLANSYEHDEYGWSTEIKEERRKQVEKRKRKFFTYQKKLPPPSFYGEKEADLTLVAWGSTKGPVIQAIEELKEEAKFKLNFLHFNRIWPFPTIWVKNILKKAKKTLLLEGNADAQLGALIRQETGFEIKNQYLRYDGRPFYPEEIKRKIKEILS